ncbi:MAG: PAS domain S-box protein [Pseudomonadota bacterium]
MVKKPTYEELERKVQELEKQGEKFKIAEDSLRQSEERFRSIVESTTDCILVWDREYNYIYANQAAIDHVGTTRDKVIGKNIYDGLGHIPEFMDLWKGRIDEIFATGRTMRVEDKIPVGDKVIFRESVLSPILDADGRMFAVSVVYRDVTDRRQAEQALKTSQERLTHLAQIINFLPDATFAIDTEGKVIAWNQAIENMTGKKAQEMLGKGDYEYAIPFYGERRPVLIDIVGNWDKEIEKKYQYVRREGESLISETYDPLVKSGGTLWNKASLLYDNNGAVIGAIESIRDITDRKVAEEVLRESEERYRTLVDNLPVSVYRNLPGPEGQFLMANPAFCNMFGFKNEEEVKKVAPADLYANPEEREQYSDNLIEKGVVENDERTLVKRDGTPVHTSITSRVVYRKDGEVSHFDSIMLDITEQKRLADRLQQAQKMEAVATLAGGVAHEFNNALMGIVGNIELLKMDLPEDEGRDKYFEAMKSASYRMSRLTDQLLAYARGGKYQPKDLRLDDFVIQTLPILQHDLNPAIRVETHFSKDIPYIKADYTQMQMVLSVIVANSNEAIEDEGLIKITAENKDLDEDFTKQYPGLKLGSYICLTVEDDGKGMDEETRSRIFEPFFTTKFHGRGMGMPAVYGIVKNHDGWISVDSELGKGTTVRIYLPAISAGSREGAKAVTQPEVELGIGEGTILVIEDEEMVIEVTQAMLERLGYRVMVARTGKAAVHIAETFDGQIDLALLDIKLPDIEGGKVYPLIMKARPDLKVIVFSGFAIEGPAREILDAGAQDFIQKPFSLATLSEKVKEVLEGQISLRG